MAPLQPKYQQTKSFEEILEISQELVEKIADILRTYDWTVRKYHDSEPFIFPNGEEIRGLDILTASKGASIFIDAKDFGRMARIQPFCTGLPITLVQRYRKIKKIFGLDCYLFFRDNEVVEEVWPSNFKANNGDFRIYGGEINSFRQHPRSRDPSILCGWNKELQELWLLSSMREIDAILRNWDIRQLDLFGKI